MITAVPFGTTPNDETVTLYALTNSSGSEAQILDYGGIIKSISVPDKTGAYDNVVLDYESLDEYLADTYYFGGIIGRYCNRIAGARFQIDGVEHRLTANEGANHLHGGRVGFGKKLWKSEDISDTKIPQLQLSYTSPAFEEGFPGTLSVTVTYQLTEESELVIHYGAEADKKTIINLTNHAYFNLAGAGMGTILDHELLILARDFTPVDASFIPTGEIRAVDGSPFDFRTPISIGSKLDSPDEQLDFAKGYDHNFILDKTAGKAPTLAARVFDPSSGRILEVLTTEPGLQFYSGNHLGSVRHGESSAIHNRYAGFCLEAQHFPNSPNIGHFPSTILEPEQRYEQRTTYRFFTD